MGGSGRDVEPRGGPGTEGHAGAPGRGATWGPRDGVPINSGPSVPGRLNFGIGSEIGSEIGGVGYGVFFAPGSRSRDQKNTSKNTTIRHLDFHLQNPNLPEGCFNRRTDYSSQCQGWPKGGRGPRGRRGARTGRRDADQRVCVVRPVARRRRRASGHATACARVAAQQPAAGHASRCGARSLGRRARLDRDPRPELRWGRR